MQLRKTFPTFSALALCATLGCGGAHSSSEPTSPKKPARNESAADAVHDDGMASVIATVTGGTLGPYVGYGATGALALFAPASEEKGRRWLAQPLDAQGAANGSPVDVGAGPQDVPFAVVRAIGNEYVALWVRQVHRADVLEGVVLGKDGTPADTIQVIAQARGEVVWAEAFETAKGTMVLWAEQTGDRARLKRVMLESGGKPVGNGDVLAHDVRAWEAVGLDDGAAVALVLASEQDPTLGSVALLRIDASGKALGEPVPISSGASAQLDVGIVRTPRSLVLAWTERRPTESLVFAAVTDLNGRLMVAPRAPLPPQGDQAVVALLAPPREDPNQALLVYEELPSRRKGPREVRLANLSAEAVVSDKTMTLAFSPVGRPMADFATTPDGYLLLTRSAECQDDGSCGERRVPWYVRIGADLTVDGAGPLLVDALDREPPAVVWAPGCTRSACFAWAVGRRDPARVVTVKMPKGSVAPGVPAESVAPPAPPLPRSNRTIHITQEPISKIDAATAGQTTFVGWVTHFVEGLGTPRLPPPGAPGDPRKPMEAMFAVQRLNAAGELIDAPALLSVRAVSAGGLALAPGAKGTEVCAAWVGRDNNDPQLFVTRVGIDGKTKLQRMVSRAKGDAADVAIVPYGDGWIVGWVDWRDGNGEVYVTRLNSMLVSLGPEKRITNAPGDASDVSLLVDGDEVLVAYGDPRDHPAHGMANPYVQKLRVINLERTGDERRIATSDLHANGVRLARAGEDVVVSWLEQAPREAGAVADAGVRVARLDVGSLRPVGETNDMGAKGSTAPLSLTFACQRGVCRGAMLVPSASGTDLEGFSWFPSTGEVKRGRIARASGPSAADTAPATVGEQVFFVDQGFEGDNRIRRVHVRWE